MDQQAIEKLLSASLDDQKMSRAERATLRDVLDRFVDNRHERDWLLSRVFAIARQSLVGPDAQKTVDWLESVSRILVHAERNACDVEEQEPDEALFSPGRDCRARIQEAIRMSRQSIEICVFTITDDRISDAILDSFQRGVSVRVVSDNDKARDKGNDVHRLRQRGVPVVFDRTPHHMHHKFAIFDRRCVVTGSYNWTRSAASDNHENIVMLNRPAIIQSFRAEFEKLWNEFGGD